MEKAEAEAEAVSMLQETVRTLQSLAERNKSIVIAYSDGKDSRVVMDLCVRLFKNVEAFFMYLVPGLDCVQIALDQARARWGVTVRQYPHWLTARLMKQGIYCHPTWRNDDLPEVKLHDIYLMAMADTGCRLVATGAKKSDSSWRRRFMSVKSAEVCTPIEGWNKYDVLSYLRMRAIPLPPSSGKSATGIDLSPDSLLWLHDTFPQDFARVCEHFPFAEAIVWRRKFYSA